MSKLPGLLCLIAVPAAAAAQTSSQTIDEVRKEARIHAGALYLTPSVQLQELGIDTNVFNQATGERRSDFTFTLGPNVDAWVPVARRALISTTAGADLVWYAKYVGERSVNPHVSVGGNLYLNRLTLFSGYAYLDTRQRPSHEIDLRSRRVENTATAGIDYRVTPKFSMELAGHRITTEFDGDAFFLGTSLREALDRTSGGGSLTARHRLTPLTTLSLKAEMFGDRFSFSPNRDTDSLRIMPGVQFEPRALISGSAAAGFRRFTAKDESAFPSYSGFVANVSLSYTLLGSTSFGVNYGRDVNYSFEPLQPYYVDNSVGASIRRALAGRFDALLSADRHLYDYRDLLAGGAVFSSGREPRQDTTWNYAGSIGYKLGRDGRIGFGASYWRRTSRTRSFRDYDGLRIRTTVTYGF